MDTERARRCIADLLALRVAFEALLMRTDDARRRELIALRRNQVAALAALAAGCEALFQDEAAKDLAASYRNRVSRYRSALALHQADWPAVIVNEDPDAHRLSANKVREAENDLLTWLQRVLAAVDGQGSWPPADV